MATEEPQLPDGLKTPSAYDDEEDIDIEPEPGETLTALVLNVSTFEKDWGEGWRLKLKSEDNGDVGTMVAKGDLKALIRDGDLEDGSVVTMVKGVTQETYNGNDYYPIRAGVHEEDN